MSASESAADGDLWWVRCPLNPMGDNLKAEALRSCSSVGLPLPPSAAAHGQAGAWFSLCHPSTAASVSGWEAKGISVWFSSTVASGHGISQHHLMLLLP